MGEEITESVGKRLREAITEHWVRPEGGNTSIRAFQRQMEARAEDPRAVDLEEGKKLRGVSYPSINSYLKKGGTTPSLDFLKEAADVLGVRHEWLASGHGSPTTSETEIHAQVGREALQQQEETPGQKLRRRIQAEHDSFEKLPPWARNRFLVLLSRLAVSAPDGANLVDTEEGRDQLVQLAGDLLWYITLPLEWKPYKDDDRCIGTWGFAGNPVKGSERSREQFLDTTLLALDHVILGRSEGQSIEEAHTSPLRWLRREYEKTVERIEENLPDGEEVIEEPRPWVGDTPALTPDEEEA